MRDVVACVALVSLLAGACDDESEALIVDASYGDAAMQDAGLWECQRADEEVAKRYVAADAGRPSELTRCLKDEDCTTWHQPVFRCEDRNVQLSYCGAPLALDKVEAAQSWFHQLEQELCPYIKPNCRASPSCVGGALRCVAARCVLVRDAGVLAGEAAR